MSKKVDDFPRITVKWADHYFVAEDMTLEEIEDQCSKPLIGRYSGYLVFENKRMIAVAGNLWEEDTEDAIGPTMCIMKRSIVYRSDKDENN